MALPVITSWILLAFPLLTVHGQSIRCNGDNLLRALQRNTGGVLFCENYSSIATKPLPTFLPSTSYLAQSISSACYCLTYSISSTTLSTKSSSVKSTSTSTSTSSSITIPTTSTTPSSCSSPISVTVTSSVTITVSTSETIDTCLVSSTASPPSSTSCPSPSTITSVSTVTAAASTCAASSVTITTTSTITNSPSACPSPTPTTCPSASTSSTTTLSAAYCSPTLPSILVTPSNISWTTWNYPWIPPGPPGPPAPYLLQLPQFDSSTECDPSGWMVACIAEQAFSGLTSYFIILDNFGNLWCGATIDYSDPSSMTTQAGPGDFFDVVNAWSAVVPRNPPVAPQIWSPYISGGWIAVNYPFISPNVYEIFPMGQYPDVLLPTFNPPQELLEQCFALSVPQVVENGSEPLEPGAFAIVASTSNNLYCIVYVQTLDINDLTASNLQNIAEADSDPIVSAWTWVIFVPGDTTVIGPGT